MKKGIQTIGLLLIIADFIASKISIFSPSYLQTKYENIAFQSKISSFGRVPYGHTIMGRLKVAYPTHGCGEVHISGETDSSTSLIILMKRGNCSYYEKVLNGQKLKASLVLIANDHDENMNLVFPYVWPNQSASIHIPSMLIDNVSGNQLIEDIINMERQGQSEAVISVSFDISKSERPEVVYKMDLEEYELFQTIFGLENMFRDVRNRTVIVPAFNLLSSADPVKDNVYCLNTNQYCSNRSDGVKVHTEDEPVFEIVRQLCVFQSSLEIWYAYASHFYQQCLENKGNEGQGTLAVKLKSCSDKILETIDFDKFAEKANYTECLSGLEENHSIKNGSALHKHLQVNNDMRMMMASPLKSSVMINGQLMFGRIDSTDILKEICSAFVSKPHECLRIDREEKIIFVDGKSSLTFWGAIWFLIKVILVGGILVGAFYVIYKIKLRKDLNHALAEHNRRGDVDSALSSYYENKSRASLAPSEIEIKDDDDEQEADATIVL